MPDSPAIQLLTDDGMAGHGWEGHPESPERLGAVVQGVEDAANELGVALERSRVDAASTEELERIHAPWYIAALDAAASRGGGWIDGDTHVAEGSMRAARLAAGATITAARAAFQGAATVAFAVVRPPGHHAAEERAAGFCLINNVAIAAAALRAEGLAQRIAIVDWDVHHGDGTQAVFDADPDLCYASTHQFPYYPGTGTPDEQGSGEAIGTKHNVPLPAGAGDDAFEEAWLGRLLPAVENFAPEAILVSCGFDAHRADPLAMLRVSEDGFGTVAGELGQVARRLGIRGVALTLEGGYHLEALRASASMTVTSLARGLIG